MIVEFRQGVPKGCIDWLWANIGQGNIYPSKWPSSEINTGKLMAPCDNDHWKYERVAVPKTPHAFGDDPFEYVPTITIKDEKLATLFALRWSS